MAMKLDIPEHLKPALKKLLREGNWAYQRYHCPCGNICNRYDKSGKCSCGLPIADIPQMVKYEQASILPAMPDAKEPQERKLLGTNELHS